MRAAAALGLMGLLAGTPSASRGGDPSGDSGLVSPPPTLELAAAGASPAPACLQSGEVRAYVTGLQQRIAGAWEHPAIWGPIEPVELAVAFDASGVHAAGAAEHASETLAAAVLRALETAGPGAPPACLLPKPAILVVLVPYLLPPRQSASVQTKVWEIPVWSRGMPNATEELPLREPGAGEKPAD
jgi:hypothetical protein